MRPWELGLKSAGYPVFKWELLSSCLVLLESAQDHCKFLTVVYVGSIESVPVVTAGRVRICSLGSSCLEWN